MELEEIYKAYFQDVYRYIRRLSGSGQIAKNLCKRAGKRRKNGAEKEM